MNQYLSLENWSPVVPRVTVCVSNTRQYIAYFPYFRIYANVWAHFSNISNYVEHRAGLAVPEGLIQNDQPIFQAALACQATHLFTGDIKDFGPFMNQPENTFGIYILTVAKFLSHLH